MEKRARQSEQCTDWTTQYARQINGPGASAAAQGGHTFVCPQPAGLAGVRKINIFGRSRLWSSLDNGGSDVHDMPAEPPRRDPLTRLLSTGTTAMYILSTA